MSNKQLVDAKIIDRCRNRLIDMRMDLLNRLNTVHADYRSRDTGGDEIDQSVAALAEHEFVTNQQRIRTQILEVDAALARIERGRFGICEETEEPIETERLLAVPWTRLSIEGAEIQESLRKKFARS